MSYDLYLSGRQLSASEFTSYFSARANYKVSELQVFYQNEDTGVYFFFNRNRADEPELDPDAPRYDVAFNMNYFRPHIFGLEAEPEVRAFIEAFGFSIHDPQNGGMGNGPYSAQGFLAGWNAGNEFGYQAILNDPRNSSSTVASYPYAAHEKIWQWNLNKNGVQERYGNDLFVPKIFFVLADGKIASTVVWGDAIPSVLPQVDLIIVPRKELAPRQLLQKKDDMCLVNFGQLNRMFDQYLVQIFSLPALVLPHPRSTVPVIDFVRRLRPTEVKLAGLSVDKVLDQELVERYRPSN